MSKNKRFKIIKDFKPPTFVDMRTAIHYDCEESVELLNSLSEEIDYLLTNMEKLEEENYRIKTKGLKLLDFYESKLIDVFGTEDYQEVCDEIWLVKFILYELGVLNGDG